MDRDLPIISEDPETLMKFKKSKKFRNTSVEASVLQTWIKYWSGQAAFVAL